MGEKVKKFTVSALALSHFSYNQLRNGLVLSLIGLKVPFPFVRFSKMRKNKRRVVEQYDQKNAA